MSQLPPRHELGDDSGTASPGLVSVIVPTKDAAGLLEPCLVSIRAQSWPELELVVVDNHSSDHTRLIAERYADHVIMAGPERSAQRNIGAQSARGDILAFIDADMLLEPDVIAESMALLRDPTVTMVVLPELTIATGVFGRARELEKQLYLGDNAVEAARVFRREELAAVGGFDTRYTGFEDWDLPDRVRAAGGRQERTTSLVWHQEGRVSLRAQYRKKRGYGARSRLYLTGRAGSFRRSAILRASLLRRPTLLVRHPIRSGALAVLKFVELAGLLRGAVATHESAAPTMDRSPGAFRVLHVISSFSLHEGMGRAIHEIAATSLDEHHVLGAKIGPATGRFASVTQVGGALSSYLFTRRRSVRDAVRSVQPDVFHFHGGVFTPLMARLPVFRAKPKILSIYSWPTFPSRRRLRSVGLRSLITSQVLPPRLFASAALPTAWVRQAVAKPDVLGALTPDLHVVERLAPLAHKVSHVMLGAAQDERRAHYDPIHPRIVFAGRAEMVRGIDTLIAAMPLVREKIPGARLALFLLPRPDLPALLERLTNDGPSDRLDISTAPVPDLRSEFTSSTVAVFPFKFGNVTLTPPLTVVEAMSVGLPVVATDVRCTSAIIEHDYNGVLVPVGDPPSLADALVTLLTDEARWRRIADGAVSTVRERFDWHALTDRAAQLYGIAKSCAGTRASGAP